VRQGLIKLNQALINSDQFQLINHKSFHHLYVRDENIWLVVRNFFNSFMSLSASVSAYLMRSPCRISSRMNRGHALAVSDCEGLPSLLRPGNYIFQDHPDYLQGIFTHSEQ